MTYRRPTALYYDMMQYQPENRRLLETVFELTVLPDPGHDDDAVLAATEVCFAPLGYRFDRAKMDRMPRLRAVASNTTGHPHIDVDGAAERGVHVVTLKPEKAFLDTITPTAEHTIGLLLALTRNVVPANRAFLEGRWNRRPFGGRAMLSRMSLGVIGLGRLGRKVAEYGRAFGMTVGYYDPYVDAAPDGVVRYDDLKELVGCSDVVSLHVPHEPETTNLIDASVFAAFKPGAVFINTARGELMDFQALLRGLESGQLAGAALDVFEDEFAPDFEARLRQHPLWAYARRHDNLLVTPHIGGSTFDAWRETERRTIDRLVEVLGLAPSAVA